MPWALVIRWLLRLLTSLAIWRLATIRRGPRGTSSPPLRRGDPARRLDPRGAAIAIREGASVGWRALSGAVFLVAALILVTAGVTTTVLSPRWLGALLLALAVASLCAAALEVRMVLILLGQRRRRRHDQDLRRQLS